MHGSKIPIWFFIGLLLTIYGVLICGYGVLEAVTGSYPKGVQLTQLHTPIWWGGILLVVGLLYLAKFRPRRSE